MTSTEGDVAVVGLVVKYAFPNDNDWQLTGKAATRHVVAARRRMKGQNED